MLPTNPVPTLALVNLWTSLWCSFSAGEHQPEKGHAYHATLSKEEREKRMNKSFVGNTTSSWQLGKPNGHCALLSPALTENQPCAECTWKSVGSILKIVTALQSGETHWELIGKKERKLFLLFICLIKLKKKKKPTKNY